MGDDEASTSVLLVRFNEDADRAAAVERLREDFPDTVLVTPVPARPLQTLHKLVVLPVALAATVVALALAAAAAASVASVRRRRRDLAVLKVLGMRRDQVRTVLRWQALTWALLALAIGVPGGLALGAIGWRSVVRSVGLEQSLSAPVMTTMLVVIAVPAVIIALTWWPARRAAASHPAITLRSE